MGPAAAVRAATAGLFVFLVYAAILALLGSQSEARMVEAVALAAAGSGRGRTEVAGQVACRGRARNCDGKGSATGGHLAEEQDLLDLVHRGQIQGIELVH